ncbi:hypothetical protein BJY00DRAFT_310083 [Aspergillus carlsbadensis]|nr:hypothetical protein BJY00DRAFT_310083 [Aspergillus carlsbadensis]
MAPDRAYFLFNLIIALASYDTGLRLALLPALPQLPAPTTLSDHLDQPEPTAREPDTVLYDSWIIIVDPLPAPQDFGLACAYCGAPNPTLRLSTASAAVIFCQSSVAAFPLSSIGPMHDAALTKKELASGWIARATSIRELAPNLALLDQVSISK